MRQLSLTGELAAARQALEAAGIAADLPSAVDDVPARYRELFAFALREGITNVVRHSGASPLTARETEVLRAARGGDTVADLAATLHLSEGTVRNHLSAAIGKTGARNRAEAVRVAEDHGWLL
jgi:DNA-binding NarL/FixJ family response regulator